MSFTSHGKENTCLAAKTGTILHKKCFAIFSFVAHPDEYLHILLNIYLFIIYLNIYLFVIYIFNPCRWWRQWSSWGLYKCSNYKFINFFLREGRRWAQNPSEKNIAGKKHEKMPQYFARLIVSLSSQVVVQFQILVTLYLYSVSWQ